ncbi:MAG: hypothetical protein JWP02_1469 [Acidimicrobiales bacterium]|nr:hypothetical protein [Acidimicrobiales bacterium]
MGAMATVLRQRVAEAGAQLELLVLASDPAGCIGVDLASGAFVRAHHPADGGRFLKPFAVAHGQLAGTDTDDAAEPERAELTEPPRPTARLHPRQAERWLRPLLHPPRPPLLGLAGNAFPYWTLQGDRPSVALIEPEQIGVARVAGGYVCRFLWLDTFHELFLRDRRLTAALTRHQVERSGGRQLDAFLGHAPDRLLVALTPPMQGYCYKAVMAVLPRR